MDLKHKRGKVAVEGWDYGIKPKELSELCGRAFGEALDQELRADPPSVWLPTNRRCRLDNPLTMHLELALTGDIDGVVFETTLQDVVNEKIDAYCIDGKIADDEGAYGEELARSLSRALRELADQIDSRLE